ncbi:MAG TPA: RNA polymerase-binding protein DksA [Zoogloea sp.]|jgi:DnaK suppressor protein|uniref:RNA polymerase-binding protein DksA n=1 Tax=Betaproteobacteria TaxID=28216 RepID=UPI001B3F01D0|nr:MULTISPECIES: RNA polymerase-binding protein DksA [Betaproteobacteria]MBP8266942.1 RNA polymerase-binding protein DksA [Zoogloea sp.]HOB45622.1 RNA polymerase-binding protein DksA [Zoogloea sp.]HQA09199.1 RNA polymerase-binding protein DksA [Zoogloea sp.]HQE39796.1 RNA polymerase-binding protein DksA [Zoogloea sp.]
MVATTTSKDKLLTEAEILVMPEEDYMNPAQLEFFRLRLSKMRDELLENAASTGANLRENELVADPADRATVEEEHALELRVRDRERKLIKKIEEALERIAEGEYGWCEETGDPIGIGRLLARPTATLSIDAQERRERTQKLYGE